MSCLQLFLTFRNRCNKRFGKEKKARCVQIYHTKTRRIWSTSLHYVYTVCCFPCVWLSFWLLGHTKIICPPSSIVGSEVFLSKIQLVTIVSLQDLLLQAEVTKGLVRYIVSTTTISRFRCFCCFFINMLILMHRFKLFHFLVSYKQSKCQDQTLICTCINVKDNMHQLVYYEPKIFYSIH